MRTLIVAVMTLCSVAVVATFDAQNASEPTNVTPQRPLRLSTLAASEPCPISVDAGRIVPPSPHIFGGAFWFGSDPIYMAVLWGQGNRFSLAPIPVENGIWRAKTAWVANPSYTGIIESRGRSLRGDDRVLLFSSGSGLSESMRLDAPHVMLDAGPVGTNSRLSPGAPTANSEWSFWPASTYIPGPGCYGIQIDTPERSQIVVFEAL